MCIHCSKCSFSVQNAHILLKWSIARKNAHNVHHIPYNVHTLLKVQTLLKWSIAHKWSQNAIIFIKMGLHCSKRDHNFINCPWNAHKMHIYSQILVKPEHILLKMRIYIVKSIKVPIQCSQNAKPSNIPKGLSITFKYTL